MKSAPVKPVPTYYAELSQDIRLASRKDRMHGLTEFINAELETMRQNEPDLHSLTTEVLAHLVAEQPPVCSREVGAGYVSMLGILAYRMGFKLVKE